MDKAFEPNALEQRWYKTWEEAGVFQPTGDGPSYCIVLPPPNVTGTLHMGHAFQDTLMDALIRYHRMSGSKTLWQVGTDHAGIATQMVVERQLLANQQTRHDLGRAAFVEKIWEWKKISGDAIGQQMRRLGVSADWSREKFTMDPALSDNVQAVFIQLYEEGLIYRGKRLVNWDPSLRSAVSDLEVIVEEVPGHLWYLRYPLSDGSGALTVATSRPETLFGDVAVAVHPDDPRYSSYIGKTIALPLTNRTIPIIADSSVLPEFGTGCVKITPAHDHRDYEMGLRHNLPFLNILTPEAHLNDEVPLVYQGLPRFDARTRVIADLEASGQLEKIEPYLIKLPKCDRTGQIIEPYLTDQWFVKMAPLAAPAIAAVENKEIQFVPENWANTYFEWMRNIQDWCISRQLWWGHRIPAWYDQHGQVYVGPDEVTIRTKNSLSPDITLTQDADVLDTWFSSALWPFSALGWPENEDYHRFYPTQTLVTGFDIIFFWVARMIMMGLKFTGKAPFKTVYVHGLIQDGEGQKMSKSKGNVIDPIDLIDGIDLAGLMEKRTHGLMQPQMKNKIIADTKKQFPNGISAYGVDALRFTFCALASSNRHIRFDLARIEGYRHFCNKLWNAARFVKMQTELHGVARIEATHTSLADRWICDQLEALKLEVHTHWKTFRFDLLSKVLYDFIWNTYCDWYIELSKLTLTTAANTKQKQATTGTLVFVLEELLTMLHPIMPFITEEIWQHLPPHSTKTTFLITRTYSQPDATSQDLAARQTMALIQASILAIRNLRAERNIPPGQRIFLYARTKNKNAKETLENGRHYFMGLAKISDIHWLTEEEIPPAAISTVADFFEFYLPVSEFLDEKKEILRLEKEIAKITLDITQSSARLENPGYVDKAPKAVVDKERARLATLQGDKEKLTRMLTAIKPQ